jgi:hypothetical protein
MTMMTETSRDDEHNEDAMVRLMFGMLCPPEDKAASRAGGADPSQTKRPWTG